MKGSRASRLSCATRPAVARPFVGFRMIQALACCLASAAALILASDVVVGESTIPVSDEEVVRGDPSRPWIALVFNVGAGSEPAISILDTLAEKDYRATFFVLGWWAEKNPDLLRRMAEEGH